VCKKLSISRSSREKLDLNQGALRKEFLDRTFVFGTPEARRRPLVRIRRSGGNVLGLSKHEETFSSEQGLHSFHHFSPITLGHRSSETDVACRLRELS
jgi:hypothetical protein